MERLIQWFLKKLSDWQYKIDRENTQYRIINIWNALDFYDVHFELLNGPFKGTIVRYTKFEINEQTSEVEYAIKIVNGPLPKSERKYVRLQSIMGIVLEKHIKLAMTHHQDLKSEILNDDTEDRTDYIEEPVVQRTVRKKGASAPKRRVRSRQVGKTTAGRDKGVHSKVQPSAEPDSDTVVPRSKGRN